MVNLRNVFKLVLFVLCVIIVVACYNAIILIYVVLPDDDSNYEYPHQQLCDITSFAKPYDCDYLQTDIPVGCDYFCSPSQRFCNVVDMEPINEYNQTDCCYQKNDIQVSCPVYHGICFEVTSYQAYIPGTNVTLKYHPTPTLKVKPGINPDWDQYMKYQNYTQQFYCYFNSRGDQLTGLNQYEDDHENVHKYLNSKSMNFVFNFIVLMMMVNGIIICSGCFWSNHLYQTLFKSQNGSQPLLNSRSVHLFNNGSMSYTEPKPVVEIDLEQQKIYICDECAVCLDCKPEITFQPCGHTPMCKECYSCYDKKECPLCKATVIKVIEVQYT